MQLGPSICAIRPSDFRFGGWGGRRGSRDGQVIGRDTAQIEKGVCVSGRGKGGQQVGLITKPCPCRPGCWTASPAKISVGRTGMVRAMLDRLHILRVPTSPVLHHWFALGLRRCPANRHQALRHCRPAIYPPVVLHYLMTRRTQRRCKEIRSKNQNDREAGACGQHFLE